MGGRHRPVTHHAMRTAAQDRRPTSAGALRLGLRANLAQFSLLVAVNALVGGTIGQERTVLPLLAEREFGLTAYTAGLTFIVAFGITKALTNLVAGALSDRLGRKPVLVAGWIVGIPVPLLLMWAPAWGWVVFANVLLGINQGLTWSTTVIMKIDLAGPERRGLAMGLNEAAGYGAVAATAAITGWIASTHGLRPEPFLLGAAYIALGLGLSAVFVRETRDHARKEAADHATPGEHLTVRRVLTHTSIQNRDLLAVNQAGLVNNLNDGLAWGLLPVLFAADGLSIGDVGLIAALYPGVWGAGQLVTGALSDRVGRKPLIVGGMLAQAAALAIFAGATGFGPWAFAAVVLGVGTALVYPTLLAAIGDVAHPAWRASAVGVYRLWRDSGYALGALIGGITADLIGLRGAVAIIGALTAASGLLVARILRETHRRKPSEPVTR
jgi:MFS family permease